MESRISVEKCRFSVKMQIQCWKMQNQCDDHQCWNIPWKKTRQSHKDQKSLHISIFHFWQNFEAVHGMFIPSAKIREIHFLVFFIYPVQHRSWNTVLPPTPTPTPRAVSIWLFLSHFACFSTMETVSLKLSANGVIFSQKSSNGDWKLQFLWLCNFSKWWVTESQNRFYTLYEKDTKNF